MFRRVPVHVSGTRSPPLTNPPPLWVGWVDSCACGAYRIYSAEHTNQWAITIMHQRSFFIHRFTAKSKNIMQNMAYFLLMAWAFRVSGRASHE